MFCVKGETVTSVFDLSLLISNESFLITEDSGLPMPGFLFLFIEKTDHQYKKKRDGSKDKNRSDRSGLKTSTPYRSKNINGKK
ncbi:hypothetical protein C3V39_07210 [Prevotella sp. oral taxon 820]|nr:hypothetical protein C3V39_06075 [Prevotella sp. oral taxon 820]PTL26840.1 hypothetical protein C3V39_07210 [Prevotella sp. oral taxon 820]